MTSITAVTATRPKETTTRTVTKLQLTLKQPWVLWRNAAVTLFVFLAASTSTVAAKPTTTAFLVVPKSSRCRQQQQRQNHLTNDECFRSTDVSLFSSSSSTSPSVSFAADSTEDLEISCDFGDEQQQQQRQPFMVTGVAPKDGPLNEAVARVLQEQGIKKTLLEANELVEMGAVWARMEGLSEEDLLAQYELDDDTSNFAAADSNNNEQSSRSGSSRVLYADLDNFRRKKRGAFDNNNNNNEDDGDLDDYLEYMESLRFRRILTPSSIEAGTDLRIYPNPRRFPACQEFKPASLLYQDTTFVVVDKPPMLPTQPDASNYQECCPGCVQSQLGPFFDIQGNMIRRPLLCHRVDSVVGGCVVLSKDRNGQRVFAQFQRERSVRKLYLAVTDEQVPLGQHIHWMWANNNGGQKPPCQLISHKSPASRRKAKQFWSRCVLEVTKCEPITIPDSVLNKENPSSSSSSATTTTYYQSTIRLVTGRKHQVRAQLASLGCPILRDTLYEPLKGFTLDKLEEQAAAQQNDDDDEEYDPDEEMDRAISQCRVPTQPIALQAHAIAFGGIRVKARAPWWAKGAASTADSNEE